MTSDSDYFAKVELENEGRCYRTELLFEQTDPDCVFQVVQAFYEGRKADLILRIFGSDEDGYFLELEPCSKDHAILDIVPEDLLEIYSSVQKIREKYDLSARIPGCEIKPYFRSLEHQRRLSPS